MITLNDSDILAGTTQGPVEDAPGYYNLKYTLPGGDGHVITSENLPQDKIKGGVLIAWCNQVRAQYQALEEGKEEEKEATRQKRLKEEEKAKAEVEAIAKQAGIDPSQVAWDIPSNIPAQTNRSPTNVDQLWNEYSLALGKVERLAAKLRAAGEL